MIICKTPFRISYFGGGTDIPIWYQKNNGLTISTTINKYCLVVLRKNPDFIHHKYVVRYFKNEYHNKIDQIEHPVVKQVLKKYNKQRDGIEIVHFADLPGRSGLGSSSAFTVSMIHLINRYNNKIISKSELAKLSINMEQNILKEKVGSQDQYACSFGGFNSIIYSKNKKITVNRIKINNDKKNILRNNTLIFFTGFQRLAHDIEKSKIADMKNKYHYYNNIYSLAKEAKKILESNNKNFLNDIGNLLNESWLYKKELSNKVSNKNIDDLYNYGIKNGAIGGKLLGAGAGGFFMFLTKNELDKKKLIYKLNRINHIPFDFDELGSQIIYKNID